VRERGESRTTSLHRFWILERDKEDLFDGDVGSGGQGTKKKFEWLQAIAAQGLMGADLDLRRRARTWRLRRLPGSREVRAANGRSWSGDLLLLNPPGAPSCFRCAASATLQENPNGELPFWALNLPDGRLTPPLLLCPKVRSSAAESRAR
jgi:hypothetical protein